MPQMDATNAGSSDDFRDGGRPAPGRYHVVINTGEEIVSPEKGTPGTEIEFQVLASHPPGQEGKMLKETFWHSQKAIGRLASFAMAAGVLRPGENKDVTGPDYPGHQLVIEVQERKYTDRDGNEKTTVEVSFEGFWEVNHPEVASVPKDAAALAQMGQSAPTTAPAANPLTPPAPAAPMATPVQQAPPAAAPPAPAGNTWGNVQ